MPKFFQKQNNNDYILSQYNNNNTDNNINTYNSFYARENCKE
jgi:hypothetical protein